MKSVSVECPKCFKSYIIPEHLAGFIIECPGCKEKFYLSVDGSAQLNNERNKDKKNGKEKWKFFSSKKEPTKASEKPVRPMSSIRKSKLDLSDEDKAYEKLIKDKLYKYVDMIIQASGIFAAILISISLFLPAIVLSKTETISMFSAGFGLKQVGAILSIISPEKFLFYFIILIPIASLISIVVDVKNIIQKNSCQFFYRLILMLVCIAYFVLVSVLIFGGGIKFDTQNAFVANVMSLHESGGLASVFKNVFSIGSMILFFGFAILVIVNLLDFTMFLKRRKVEV